MESEEQTVRTTERLWSEEVGIAEADDPKPARDTAYVFSNGRKFVESDAGPYEST